MLVLLTLTLTGAAPAEVVTIKDVLGSDVVIVRTESEPNLWVSLVGVGTPDTSDPRKPKHALYSFAEDPAWTKHYLKAGDRVKMVRHGHTRTGRVQAALLRLSDGLCWNEWLIRSGGAFFTTTELVDYSEQEREARDAKRGLWASYRKPQPAAPPTTNTSEVRHTFTGMPGGNPIYSKPRYIKQDWTEFNMMFGTMMQQQMMTGAYHQGGGSQGNYGMAVNPNQHMVRGFYRQNGTYVAPHVRTNPNGTTMDNLGRK